MSRKPSRTLLIVASLFALVACALAGFLLYLIYDTEATLASAEEALAIAQQEETSGVSMNHLLADTKAERDKLDGHFIGSDGVVAYIEQVESLSRLSKVDTSVNSVGIEKANVGDSFEYVTLSATSEGALGNVFWFLSLLEAIPLKLEVSQLYLDQLPTDPKTKTSKWRLTFMTKALKIK